MNSGCLDFGQPELSRSLLAETDLFEFEHAGVLGDGATSKSIDSATQRASEGVIMFKRRIGPDPHANGGDSAGLNGCPDLWELESGDFAVIGTECTHELAPHLPASASCGPDERIVVVPRAILVNARNDIPVH
jgi:hypothetical protein